MSASPVEQRDSIIGGMMLGNDKICFADDFVALLLVRISEKVAGQTWGDAVRQELEHWQEAKLASYDRDEVEDFFQQHHEGELPLTIAEIFEAELHPELVLYQDWDAMQTDIVTHSEEGHDPDHAVEILFKDVHGDVLEVFWYPDTLLEDIFSEFV